MKKILKISAIIIAILLLALLVTPFIFKGKIIEKVKAEINNNIHAKVDFRDFDLTLFRSFPNLTLTLNGLEVIGMDPFEGDTLAAMDEAAITLDLMSVFKGDKIQIRSVMLEKPIINLLILEDGRANWDIVISESDTSQSSEPSQFKVGLNHYAINDGRLVYDDASLGLRMELHQLNHTGSGDFTQDLFTLETQTASQQFFFNYAGISYITGVRTNLDADLEMDMLRSKYSFKKNELKLNELVIGFDGFVAMPADDIDMDLKFEVRKNEFRNFISMIPGMYREGFDKAQSSGTLSLNGFVKGTYSNNSMPGFGLNLLVDNGMLNYPGLPDKLSNVGIDLKISNPDGVPDNTLIRLQRMHVEVGKDPFDARMIIKTPVSDADIDASIKGKVNLANIGRIVPLEKGTELKGMFIADVTLKGRMSALDQKRYNDFNAGGTLQLDQFTYKSNDFTQGLSIPSAELIFNPKNVTLNRFSMASGRTDLSATGWVDNLIGYLFKENELLSGTIDLKSSVIDLNELTGQSSTVTSDTAASMEVVEVPVNIDFLLTAAVGKIYYDDLILENAKGNLAIREKTMGLNDFTFNMLGGSIGIDGLYDTKDLKHPFFFLNLNLSSLDIRQTYDKFVAVQKLAPIADKCNGRFSSELSAKGNLDSKMEPVLTSLSGGGKLTSSGVTIDNFKPLVKMSEALKMDQFRSLRVSDLNLSFKFENGRVSIAPFDVMLAGVKTTVQGSNGFDQTIDYTLAMKIPTSMMGSAATGVIGGLISKANQTAGTNLSMGNEVKVNVHIGGTVNDPKITTGLKDAGTTAATDIKTEIKETIKEKTQELEDKANAEAERLKKEAEDKAKAEAERLKKEAEDKAKAEADRLKKEAEQKAKKEAEEQLQNLFGKPKK